MQYGWVARGQRQGWLGTDYSLLYAPPLVLTRCERLRSAASGNTLWEATVRRQWQHAVRGDGPPPGSTRCGRRRSAARINTL